MTIVGYLMVILQKGIWKESNVSGIALTIITQNKTGRNSELSSDLKRG